MNRDSGEIFRESFLITDIPSDSPNTFILPGQWLQTNQQAKSHWNLYEEKKNYWKAKHQKVNIISDCRELAGFWFSLFVCSFQISYVSIY